MAEVKSEVRKGAWSESKKPRPVISTIDEEVEHVEGKKTLPTDEAKKIAEYWYFHKEPRKRWESEDDFKEDVRKLSLIELCQKYKRGIIPVLLKASDVMKVEYEVVSRRGKEHTEKELNEALAYSTTCTLYGFGMNTKKRPKGILSLFTAMFKQKPKTILTIRAHASKNAGIKAIPKEFQAGYERWCKSEGVKLYLEYIEEEIRKIRRGM